MISGRSGVIQIQTNVLRGKARAVLHHGFEERSGFPVARSTGTETCSRTISQSPPILR
jgi:hypothetical protein